MKIIGFGTDLTNINRFKKILKNNKLFKKRIFSLKEINYCDKKKYSYLCYAKRFAAKEAFVKAIGTGITNGISLKEIEVSNNKEGKPSLTIKGKTLAVVKKILKVKKINSFISLSDDKPCAIANVIITK